MTRIRPMAVAIASVALAGTAAAQNVVDIFGTAMGTERVGTITFQEETGGGVRFTLGLGTIVPGGAHGFHARVNPDCAPAGGRPSAGARPGG